MEYTIGETEEILSNIEAKLDAMSSVVEGLEARKGELEDHLESLLEGQARLADLRAELDELESMDLVDSDMNLWDWQDAVDGIRSAISDLEEETGE